MLHNDGLSQGCSAAEAQRVTACETLQRQERKEIEGTLLHRGELLRLGKTSKIIKSNHQPITTMPAKPCPEGPHLQVF